MLDFTLQLNKTNKDKHDVKKLFSQNTYVIDQKQSQPNAVLELNISTRVALTSLRNDLGIIVI